MNYPEPLPHRRYWTATALTNFGLIAIIGLIVTVAVLQRRESLRHLRPVRIYHLNGQYFYHNDKQGYQQWFRLTTTNETPFISRDRVLVAGLKDVHWEKADFNIELLKAIQKVVDVMVEADTTYVPERIPLAKNGDPL